MVQECLSNTHCHLGSSSVIVRLACADSIALVEIEDNRARIPSEKLKEFESTGLSGVGLRDMHERLRQLGGSLEVIFHTEGHDRTRQSTPPAGAENKSFSARLTFSLVAISAITLRFLCS